MQRVQKDVFLSYRRTNAPWALAVFQNLTNHGFDVFYDYEGIASGDFEQIILGNIRSRAHFLVLLTPSALERCDDPDDWFRREIETAIDTQRNIVPLLLDRFDFSARAIRGHLSGKLEQLKNYNGLEVPPSYFPEAMERLRSRHLNVPLDAVLHPASKAAKSAASNQQAAARSQQPVRDEELTAQQYFERGYAADDPAEQIRCYSEAIRLDPDYAVAYNARGNARRAQQDLGGAIEDYEAALAIDPAYAAGYVNRGVARRESGNIEAAVRDYDRAIEFDPEQPLAYYNRANARRDTGDRDAALVDYCEAIRINPNHVNSHIGRGNLHRDMGDLEAAMSDYDEALRLEPENRLALYNRGLAYEDLKRPADAIRDLQQYLDLGADVPGIDIADVRKRIRKLSKRKA